MDEFGTVLNCMDGRVQGKVAAFLASCFQMRNLDTITTAGTVRHLAEDTEQTSTLLANLDVSVAKHGSRQIAIAAHHDCAGNPVPEATQRDQVETAVRRIKGLHPDAEVVGLWVGPHWSVERIAG